MNIEELDLSVRTHNAFKRAGVNTVEEFEKMDFNKLPYIGPKGVEEARAKIAEYRKSEEMKMSNIDINIKEQPLVVETTGTVVSNENYIKALRLDTKIKESAMTAQNSLWEVCKGLKEMRNDKLYKELGYQNFEDYVETEVGIKRHMAYKYCSAAEIENVESIQHLGITKLSLLTKLEEQDRNEFLENNDVENMSVRKLEEKIKSLETESQDLKTRLESVGKISAEYREASTKYFGELQEEKEKSRKRLLEIADFKNRISDLEDELEVERCNPIDVVIDNSEEIEKLKAQHEDELAEYQGKLMAQMQIAQETQNKLKQCESDLKAAQNKPAEIQTVIDAESVFKAYMSNAVDSVNRLITFLSENTEEKYIIGCEKLLKKTLTTIDEMKVTK